MTVLNSMGQSWGYFEIMTNRTKEVIYYILHLIKNEFCETFIFQSLLLYLVKQVQKMFTHPSNNFTLMVYSPLYISLCVEPLLMCRASVHVKMFFKFDRSNTTESCENHAYHSYFVLALAALSSSCLLYCLTSLCLYPSCLEI